MAINDSTRIIMSVFYSFLFVSGTFGNACVIFVILASKRFRKLISSILITNIAVADLLVCFLTSPYYLACLLVKQPQKPGPENFESACRSFIFLAYLLGFTRILLLAIISLERFLAINHPYFYHKHHSLSMPNLPTVVACLYPWVQAFLTSSPAIFMKGWVRYVGKSGKLCGYTWENANLGFVLALMLINFCIPLAIIVFTNFKVFLTSRRQRRSIASCFNTASPTNILPSSDEERSVAERMSKRRQSGLWQNNYPATFCQRGEETRRRNLQRVQSQELSNWGSNEKYRLENPLQPSSNQLFSRTKVDADRVNEVNNISTNAVASAEQRCSNNGQMPKTQPSLETERPLQVSAILKVNGSKLRDRSLRKLSTLSSKIDFPGGRERRRRSSAYVISESLTAVSKFVDRARENSRRHTISGVKSTNFRPKTSDFIVFFSTLSVITLFLCTWLPYFFVTVVILISHSVISEEVDLAVSMITVLDSAFTPFIVLGTRSEFRKALLQKMCRLQGN